MTNLSTAAVNQGDQNSTLPRNTDIFKPGDRQALIKKLKALYRADHQVELLRLHVETDLLLQQLQGEKATTCSR